jgi:hypothetical protein
MSAPLVLMDFATILRLSASRTYVWLRNQRTSEYIYLQDTVAGSFDLVS